MTPPLQSYAFFACCVKIGAFAFDVDCVGGMHSVPVDFVLEYYFAKPCAYFREHILNRTYLEMLCFYFF